VQRKAYVTGAAACLAALLAACVGCSSSAGTGASPDEAKPNDATASATPAPPGKYRTLPEACSQVEPSMLDTLLPGIRTIADVEQREQAYDGTATATYDTDRRVGCRWTGESPYATDHLMVDFERVVSYDSTVSDDNRAREIFVSKEMAAGVEETGTPSATPGSSQKADSGGGLAANSLPADGGSALADGMRCVNPLSGSSGSTDKAADDAADKGAGKGAKGAEKTPGGAQSPAGELPSARALDGLGDGAFLDDSCAAPSSAALHRTVTVVFRTSNVIVTVEYDEQPSRIYDVPDGKRMQDRAQKLARTLAGTLSG
jgi:hypothetical protein